MKTLHSALVLHIPFIELNQTFSLTYNTKEYFFSIRASFFLFSSFSLTSTFKTNKKKNVVRKKNIHRNLTTRDWRTAITQ